MSKKRYRPGEITGKLQEADVLISQGKKVVDVIKSTQRRVVLVKQDEDALTSAIVGLASQ